MERRCSTLLVLLSLLATVPAAAMTQRYAATLEEARWQVERGTGECGLVHDIPRLGRVRFHQRSGRPLEFTLGVALSPDRHDVARVAAVPPPWKHDAMPRELGTLRIDRSVQPIHAGRTLARRLLMELEQGMFTEFHYRDWADARDEVTVVVSPVRFREVLPAFQDCVAGLIQLDFDPLAEYFIPFRTDSYRLHRLTRRQLDRIVAQYRKRGDVGRIVVGGHADERGTEPYNEVLARKRAEEIRRYLVSRGIPYSRIEVRSYGERWPANPGKDPQALAENRRATIWFTE
ncbi:OmpA family protein [Thiohalobacter sp.]|uniref:OmpA family protein n=1 Tax=Thiohalobacter sp. TaxID=2025948 RepID=UPI002607C5FF|nr:OmpA family protein [Thiohalobacter sp.]